MIATTYEVVLKQCVYFKSIASCSGSTIVVYFNITLTVCCSSTLSYCVQWFFNFCLHHTCSQRRFKGFVRLKTNKHHRYLWTGPYVAPFFFFFKMLPPPPLFFFFFFLNIDFFSYKQHFATFYVSLYDIYTINTIKQ